MYTYTLDMRAPTLYNTYLFHTLIDDYGGDYSTQPYTIRSCQSKKWLYLCHYMQFEHDCHLVKNWACLKYKFKYKYEQHWITWQAYTSVLIGIVIYVSHQLYAAKKNLVIRVTGCLGVYMIEDFYMSCIEMLNSRTRFLEAYLTLDNILIVNY